MSEEMAVFTKGNPKEFIKVYNKSKKEEYDFLYLSMKDMSARRNFGEILNNDSEPAELEEHSEGKESP
jgi:hypothetical protein